MTKQGFSTLSIHAGYEPDPATGAVNPPIYMSSTFAQNGHGQLRGGYDYGRSGNPTRGALERKLAELEDGAHALVFSSGVAALDCALRALLRPGDHVILPDNAYSGTFRLINKVFSEWNISHTAVPPGDTMALKAAIRPTTKLLCLETPTNPSLSIIDLAETSEVIRSQDIKLLVDNTFASPYLQQPLQLGADVVVHSTTKYLSGHSDVVGGALITNDESIATSCGFTRNATGAVPSPLDCYLVERGVKTLSLRMERHCDNAEAIAAYLSHLPEVASVLYPGLPEHDGYKVATQQMRRFGGMVSFTLRDQDDAPRFCAATSLFTLAESLGGVESLIEHPGSMTHKSTKNTPLEAHDGLIRLSAGIEDTNDLIDDLAQAFSTRRAR